MKESVGMVWYDTEHAGYWEPVHKYLQRKGFGVEVISYRFTPDEDILDKARNTDFFVIHTSNKTSPHLRGLFLRIKEVNPNIKIILQSEVLHPQVQDLVENFQIHFDDLASPKEMSERLLNCLQDEH